MVIDLGIWGLLDGKLQKQLLFTLVTSYHVFITHTYPVLCGWSTSDRSTDTLTWRCNRLKELNLQEVVPTAVSVVAMSAQALNTCRRHDAEPWRLTSFSSNTTCLLLEPEEGWSSCWWNRALELESTSDCTWVSAFWQSLQVHSITEVTHTLKGTHTNLDTATEVCVYTLKLAHAPAHTHWSILTLSTSTPECMCIHIKAHPSTLSHSTSAPLRSNCNQGCAPLTSVCAYQRTR